jgi:hypothetical protein
MPVAVLVQKKLMTLSNSLTISTGRERNAGYTKNYLVVVKLE